MKTARLLSIVMYLLNRERASAREMAERFCVSPRTIQRDIEAIELAGIPVYAVQGSGGGYGILESFKMDRQLMTVEDFYYIITALESIGSSLSDSQIDRTFEKIRSLIPDRGLDFLAGRTDKLSIDFSMLGGDPRHRTTFRAVRDAVDRERLLRFSYTNNKLEYSSRTVEPMTIVFRWRSWYLYGYCRLKKEYRLFRISRIQDPEALPERFLRRDRSLEEFIAGTIGEAYGELMGYLQRQGLEMSGYPFVLYHNSDMEALDAEAGFSVDRVVPGEGRVQPGTIPGGKVLSAIHTGPYTTLEKTYTPVMAHIEKEGLKVTDWMYELYLNSPEDTPENQLQTEICFPLES